MYSLRSRASALNTTAGQTPNRGGVFRADGLYRRNSRSSAAAAARSSDVGGKIANRSAKTVA